MKRASSARALEYLPSFAVLLQGLSEAAKTGLCSHLRSEGFLYGLMGFSVVYYKDSTGVAGSELLLGVARRWRRTACRSQKPDPGFLLRD